MSSTNSLYNRNTGYESTDYSFKPGFAISAFPKVYLGDNAEEGLYSGVEIEYKNYNFGIPSTTGNGNRSQSLNRLNFALIFGGSSALNIDNRYLDMHFGVGLSMVEDVRFIKQDETSTITYSPVRALFKVGIRYIFQHDIK